MKFVGKVAMPIAFLCGAFFLGACDNGGNAVLAEGSKENPSDVDKPRLDSSESSARSSSSVVFSSSSQVLEDFFNEQYSSSSIVKETSSSSVEECYKSGMASITLVGVEKISFNCPNSMTMYDTDSWTFYKCDGSTLVKKPMPPCSNNSVESSDSQSSSSSENPVSKGETKVMPSGTYDCTEYSCIPTENLNQEMLAEGLYGEFLDERDNQVYKTIQIGEQVWMAQNLNYADSVAMPSLLGGSWCYDNDEENCRKAGRLYTWGATVDSINYLAKPFDPSKCEYIDDVCEYPGKDQGICPPGWRVPDTTDFLKLYKSANRDQLAIKTQQGWCNSSNGTNELGFSAMPVGAFSNNVYHCNHERCFNSAEGIAAFWSIRMGRDSYTARAMVVDSLDFHDLVYETEIDRSTGLSVRCIKK
jgi:uncharacterized protein (TIGR02145 family)